MRTVAAHRQFGREGGLRRIVLTGRMPLMAIHEDPEGHEVAALGRMVRTDSWPMVRQAAIEALFDRPGARGTLRAAIRDRSPRVRRAAIDAATRAGDREAWPLIRARLEDDDEWPQVAIEALRYVRELCVEEAGELVLRALRRGLRPGAWAPDVDVAGVAVDLAMRLGGETAEQAARIAGREDAPPAIRAILARSQREPARCTNAASR